MSGHRDGGSQVPLDGPDSHKWDLAELRAVQRENDELRREVAALRALVAELRGGSITRGKGP